jgi:hypothetical protein
MDEHGEPDRADREPGAEVLERAAPPSPLDRVVRAWQALPLRTRRWIGVPIALVALTAGAVVAVGEPREGRPEPDASLLDQWKGTIGRGPAPLGAPPAAVGTIAYRSCANGCTVTLVGADGTTRDLADVAPDLAMRLGRQGLRGVSLSWSAVWWGYPTDDGYTITSGRRAREFLVPAGPAGSRWELLGWSPDSSGAGLAMWTRGEVTAYASTEASRVREYDEPDDGPALWPIDSDGVTATVAEPIDAPQRPRITTLRTANLTVTAAHMLGDAKAQDMSACVRPLETLLGPRGVPETTTVPPDRAAWERRATSSSATVVFAVSNGEPVPSAVIHQGCQAMPWSSDAGRYRLPRSTVGVTWRFLGVLAGGRTAMTRHEPGNDLKAVVIVGFDGEQRVLHRVPADAHVLMPGLTVR